MASKRSRSHLQNKFILKETLSSLWTSSQITLIPVFEFFPFSFQISAPMGKGYTESHPILGIIVTILTVTNVSSQAVNNNHPDLYCLQNTYMICKGVYLNCNIYNIHEFQPIMALFRPGPKDKNRPIFNWAHWAVGMAAHILGGKSRFPAL